MDLPVRAVTRGPSHHFFGYYEKSPWDATGRYMLAMEVPFGDRMPEVDDKATIGVIDLEEGCTFTPLAHTFACNWQQGAMLHWLPGADQTIIFNDRRDGAFVSIMLDIRTGSTRVLDRPVYTLSRDGSRALSLNFARIQRMRADCGYVGVPDPHEEDLHPDADGIHLLDLTTGDSRLLISYHQIASFGRVPSMDGQTSWFNHIQVNTDDSRFAFMHRRRRESQRRIYTRLFTANFDGSEIRCVTDHDFVSHYDWRDPHHILSWARRHGRGDHYYLFADNADKIDLIGEDTLTCDGHCSFSPDRRWVLNDTYPRDEGEPMRRLLLYDMATNRRVDIGRFFSPPELTGSFPCDLHPRWNRDGTQVCFDSTHTGERQMYIIDVREVVETAR